jgi:enoyl-CoA hydratase/carnithine racemase
MSLGVVPGLAADTAEPLLLERHGHVAHLVLNRPDKLNAIDGRTLALFASAIDEIEADPSIRVVLLRANGKVFCAGADLDYIGVQMRSAATFDSFLATWHTVFRRIERCDRPTIAAVHGLALAGGLELTQVCDVVVAADDAQFGDQHAKFGLFPGGGSTQRLPRLIGHRRALWLLLSGDRFSAAEAYGYGMVTRLAPADDLLIEVTAMAEQLANCSASANAAIKRAVQGGAALELDAALELERSIGVPHMLGPDAQIGLDAFKARRTPVFTGLEPTTGDDDGNT